VLQAFRVTDRPAKVSGPRCMPPLRDRAGSSIVAGHSGAPQLRPSGRRALRLPVAAQAA
jgi:hypothetical protein